MWDYTPAQAFAYCQLANVRERKRDAAELLNTATAIRSKVEDINTKIQKDWNAE